MRRFRPALFFVLLSPLLLPACTSWWPMPGRNSSPYSEQELSADMAQYAGYFSSVVSAAADEIAYQAHSRAVRRSTLVWKLRTIPWAQEVAFSDIPQKAYVKSLGLAKAIHDYLSVGDGRAIFGEHQPIAVKAAKDIEQAALAIGPRFLDSQQVARLESQLEELARKYPIRGRDFSTQRNAQIAITELDSGSTGLGWVLGIPMSPFRALEGVGSTGVALLEINRTALEVAAIIDELPRQNRWQLELLLYDIEERDTMIAGLAAFEQMAASADRASLAIDRLPDALRAALEDSTGAIAEINQVLLNARELMVPLSATVDEVGQITARIAELQADDGEAATPGRPFDIREYETALHEAGSTATELRGLLADLDETLDSGKLEGTVLQTIDTTEDELRSLVELTKFAMLQVLVVFFTLLLLYRWAGPRLARTHATRK